MARKMKWFAVCLFLLPGMLSVSALGANKSRIGTAGAQELLIPVGARGIAIGPSSSVFLTGAESIFWNPAGLSRMGGGVEAMFSHMSYIADINVAYGALGVKAGDFGDLGFTIKSISFGDIPVTTATYPDGTGELYSPTYLTLGVTYSRLLTDRISVGVTGSIVSEKILNMSASGLVFDVGIQYHNLGLQGLMLAIAVKSIGPNMSFDGSNAYVNANTSTGSRGPQTYTDPTAAFDMPTRMEIGMAYTPALDETNQLTVGGQFLNNNYSDDEYSLGLEYSFQKTFFVRGGYMFSPQTDKDITGANGYLYNWTLGAGVHYDVGGIGLSLDYAFRNVRYMDGNHIISIGLAF